MIKHPNGVFDFVADLLRPDYIDEAKSDYENYYSGGIITGAELIKFATPDKIIIFFGYDYPDSHRGTITSFDLKTKKLEKPIIDNYWIGNRGYFKITKMNKSLIFLNNPNSLSDLDREDFAYDIIKNRRGIYLVNGKEINKINLEFPNYDNFGYPPFINVEIRENYQNGRMVVMLINDEKYTFDFSKEMFIK